MESTPQPANGTQSAEAPLNSHPILCGTLTTTTGPPLVTSPPLAGGANQPSSNMLAIPPSALLELISTSIKVWDGWSGVVWYGNVVTSGSSSETLFLISSEH